MEQLFTINDMPRKPEPQPVPPNDRVLVVAGYQVQVRISRHGAGGYFGVSAKIPAINKGVGSMVTLDVGCYGVDDLDSPEAINEINQSIARLLDCLKALGVEPQKEQAA
jgi:hypothetical protein